MCVFKVFIKQNKYLTILFFFHYSKYEGQIILSVEFNSDLNVHAGPSLHISGTNFMDACYAPFLHFVNN